ncbi:MAG: hypothetical protein PVI86_06675 [Phycisphaerae bacterium]|jgi:hypothetical protein
MTRSETAEPTVTFADDSALRDEAGGASTGTRRDREEMALETRWDGTRAFVMAPLFPATTAQRTMHITLTRVWVMHVAALLLTAVVVFFLLALEGSLDARGRVVYNCGLILGHLADEIGRDAGFVLLITLGVMLACELVFLALAVMAMPWGAADERVGDSFRASLARTWLRTPHLALVVLLAGLSIIGFAEWAKALWNQDYPFGSLWVLLAEFAPVHTCFALAGWLLWGLLRSVGAPRDLVPFARPPLCETCGYNLTTIPMEGRCPECGDGVVASLGVDARCGAPWERREALGPVEAWSRTCGAVLRSPSRFGRQLQVTSGKTDHRVFFAFHLPAVFVIGVLLIPVLYFIDTGKNVFTSEPEVVFGVGLVMGGVTTIGAVCLALLSTCVLGLLHSFREGRNLLAGAMQMAAYLAPFLVWWMLFGVFSAAAVLALRESAFLGALGDYLYIDRDFLLFAFWSVPNLGVGLYYLVLVGAGTRSTRYANR